MLDALTLVLPLETSKYTHCFVPQLIQSFGNNGVTLRNTSAWCVSPLLVERFIYAPALGPTKDRVIDDYEH